MPTFKEIVLSFAECICHYFTKSKFCNLSFPFYVFFYIMTIYLCDVVMLLGFVCMITLPVSTNNRNFSMPVKLRFTSYLYVLFFLYVFIY